MKLPAIFLTNIKEAFQYKARGFIWTWWDLLPTIIQIFFWSKAFETQVMIGGQNKDSLIGYYLISGIIVPLLITHPEYSTSEDINKGNLSNHLLKPYSYLRFRIWCELGYKSNRLLFVIPSFLLLLMIAIPLIGTSFTLYFHPLMIILLINCFLITHLLRFLVGLTAFWVSEIGFLIGISDIVTLFLSGMLLPIYFFPQWFQQLSGMLPFIYETYVPTQAFLGKYTPPQLL